MGLREKLAEHHELFEAVLAVATCCDSLGFLDLLWPPLDHRAFRDRLIANREPGVCFETPSRIVVIEEHSAELRFYAGPWGPAINAHAYENEVGVFHSVADALRYAEAFLVLQVRPDQISVRRNVRAQRTVA
jgi:hypothetical protein